MLNDVEKLLPIVYNNINLFLSLEVISMNFYSNKSINFVSILISIIIYIFLFVYIPKLYSTVRDYIYYKIQPTNMQEY